MILQASDSWVHEDTKEPIWQFICGGGGFLPFYYKMLCFLAWYLSEPELEPKDDSEDVEMDMDTELDEDRNFSRQRWRKSAKSGWRCTCARGTLTQQKRLGPHSIERREHSSSLRPSALYLTSSPSSASLPLSTKHREREQDI